jgi:hypothetical protein
MLQGGTGSQAQRPTIMGHRRLRALPDGTPAAGRGLRASSTAVAPTANGDLYFADGTNARVTKIQRRQRLDLDDRAACCSHRRTERRRLSGTNDGEQCAWAVDATGKRLRLGNQGESASAELSAG